MSAAPSGSSNVVEKREGYLGDGLDYLRKWEAMP
jgi:hypothetical protein